MTTLAPPTPDTPLHPMDRGLTLLDWAERDWDGFADAVGKVFADDWNDILANLVYDAARNRAPHLPGYAVEKMNRKLWEAGNERPTWVVEWEARFIEQD